MFSIEFHEGCGCSECRLEGNSRREKLFSRAKDNGERLRNDGWEIGAASRAGAEFAIRMDCLDRACLPHRPPERPILRPGVIVDELPHVDGWAAMMVAYLKASNAAFFESWKPGESGLFEPPEPDEDE